MLANAPTKTLDSARGESHHPDFVGNWPTIIGIFLVLSTHCYWISSPYEKVELDQDFILLPLCYGVNQEN